MLIDLNSKRKHRLPDHKSECSYKQASEQFNTDNQQIQSVFINSLAAFNDYLKLQQHQ